MNEAMNEEMRVPRTVAVERRQGFVSLSFVIDGDLPCFAGHYPDAPVLPGAIQLIWAARLAAAHLAVDDAWQGLEAVKFSRVIRPGEAVTLELECDAASGDLSFRYRRADAVCSSGRLTRG